MAENPLYIYTIFIVFEQNEHGKYSQMVQTCHIDELIPNLNDMIDNYFYKLCPYIDELKILKILDNYDLVKMDVFNIFQLKCEINSDNLDMINSIIIKLYFIIQHIDMLNRFKSSTEPYSRFCIDIK